MRAGVVLAVCLTAVPALAHHRQSPQVIPLTTTGDVALPRVPAAGKKLVVLARPKAGGGREIVGFTPFRPHDMAHVLFADGDNDEPTVTARGLTVAWGSDAAGVPGSQVLQSTRGVLSQPVVDPSGTTAN